MPAGSLAITDDSGVAHCVELTPLADTSEQRAAGSVFQAAAEKADWLFSGQRAISRVPGNTALPIQPANNYALEGSVDHSGFGIAVLRVHEYDDQRLLASHKVTLEQGPFRLKFQTSSTTSRCSISVGLRGDCRIELNLIRLRNVAIDERKMIDSLVHEQGKGLLFIGGCGRSGTTMMVNMMRCFDSTYCHLVEQPWEYFTLLGDRPETNLVVKRTAGCCQRQDTIPDPIQLLYMVRHPFDVLSSKLSYVSDNFYVSGERWLGEWNGFLMLEQQRPDVRIIRYEDVVSTPDAVQQRLADAFGLTAAMSIQDFHRLAQADPPSRHQAALEGARQPDTKSVHKWLRDESARRHVLSIAEKHRHEITAFLERFGYTSASADWHSLRTGCASLSQDAA